VFRPQPSDPRYQQAQDKSQLTFWFYFEDQYKYLFFSLAREILQNHFDQLTSIVQFIILEKNPSLSQIEIRDGFATVGGFGFETKQINNDCQSETG